MYAALCLFPRTRACRRTAPLLLVLSLSGLMSLSLPLRAQILSIPYCFESSGSNQPNSTLFVAGSNLYGTTGAVGTQSGSVFKLSSSNFGTLSVLHTFSANTDGSSPNGVIRDSSGNLYGTCSQGGANSTGTVFKISSSGVFSLLHTFSALVHPTPGSPNSDGAAPMGTLIRDSSGNLYGTAEEGGSSGFGTIFKIDTTNTFSVVYNFSSPNGLPTGPMALYNGFLYGTTQYGTNADGCIYKYNLTTNTFTLLYSFSARNLNFNPATNSDGAYPTGVTADSKGNLYGSAYEGGGSGTGTIFEFSASGVFSVLHTFSTLSNGLQGTNSDGGLPPQPPIKDSAGNLYGTASSGGTSGYGTVYEIDTAKTYSVIYTFTGQAIDGKSPAAGVVEVVSGGHRYLFGDTFTGGADNVGIVYKIKL